MKIILLAGAPGSGKSTQGKSLMATNKAIIHLSAGEVVREIIKDPTHPIAIKYQELISSGNLLPDEVILEVLKTELAKYKDQEVVILLDGYPRTPAQYQNFKATWGAPTGLIYLDVPKELLSDRLAKRQTARSDDNDKAVEKRLAFYTDITQPLLLSISKEIPQAVIKEKTRDSISTTTSYLYSQLHRIPDIHTQLIKESLKTTSAPVDVRVKPVWSYSVVSQLWQTNSEHQTADAIIKGYATKNFSFSIMGKKVVYLETPHEIEAVLEAQSTLGPVYRQFSTSAGLKHDFVATDAQNPHAHVQKDGKPNIWMLIHHALAAVVRDHPKPMYRLMDKHLDALFFAEKSFDLDTTFDKFFYSFWSEYLFGAKVEAATYIDTRDKLLQAMKHCFYASNYKGLDPTGIIGAWYGYSVSAEIKEAKAKLQSFLADASDDSLAKRFKATLAGINTKENLSLTEQELNDILADNLFDLVFVPDFLANVLYETLVVAVRENSDLHNADERKRVYAKGLYQGYLFPIRSRVLEEDVNLPNGDQIASGSTVYLNLRKAGLYHSSGPRRCIGQTFTGHFKDHFFDRLAAVTFKIKTISLPEDRNQRAKNENVPATPERYTVSWALNRKEAMRHLPFHNYKGTKFFDVLSLHRKPNLNSLIIKQCVLKINKLLSHEGIDIDDVVIVAPEVRGIIIGGQVAHEMRLPAYIIRKKGGNKMDASLVCYESYAKAYGDPDVVELPKNQLQELAGKKIVLLDDGIASGESALACKHLLEKIIKNDQLEAEVVMVMTLLKHDYAEVDPVLSEDTVVKTLFDCHGGRFEGEDGVACSSGMSPFN